MGRALLAPDIEAGPKHPVGSLIFREQFSSAQSTSLLADCWATDFEKSPPIRRVAAYKGQRNFAGLWWFVSTQEHVGFESWLEHDHLIRLDFDPSVAGIASQPFSIKLPQLLPQTWHVPDYFVRQVDGTVVVLGIRPDAKVTAEDQLVFDASANLCTTVGWKYYRLGDLTGVGRANRYWLAGYRHPRCHSQATANAALKHLLNEGPCTIRNLSCVLGDPVLVLPTIFHLIWCQKIVVDLDFHLLSLQSSLRERMLGTTTEALPFQDVDVLERRKFLTCPKWIRCLAEYSALERIEANEI
ncbi:transposase [Arthrobacter sp. MYb227]|uniref:TnsA-like heteromeric transposase endonuclease subunit n=1 Tax=Arthrobacter sp. MYb227 TaxID=1848601 RepID=UPI000CFB2031|nr:TnsA-like heteromeric transposase endonuclease subunit [Arthrobacter sp. MYb227]PQZ93893.1 transposase [Arthrobacter sp. MYb227]